MIDDLLETFRQCFPLTRVSVENDYLIYKVKRGLGRSTAQEANELIEKNNWDLTAIPTRFPSDDSFFVQRNETEA